MLFRDQEEPLRTLIDRRNGRHFDWIEHPTGGAPSHKFTWAGQATQILLLSPLGNESKKEALRTDVRPTKPPGEKAHFLHLIRGRVLPTYEARPCPPPSATSKSGMVNRGSLKWAGNLVTEP
jgi:hypothetical protein